MSYKKTARFYDLIYSAKPYARESEKVDLLIQTSKQTPGNSLLDVACGTGAHLVYLQENYAATGVDLSAEMLAIARQRCPELPFMQGDMRTFDLGRQFDAVTCLFSAIAYMPIKADLNRAIANMARHLKPGGVMLIEPFLTPDVAVDGHRSADFLESATLSICRMTISKVNGNEIHFPMYHMVQDADQVVTFVEDHRLYLYTVEEMCGAFESAELSVQHDFDGLMGRGLYIATKPT
jgi:ubiquinone/menaquinone biosynthesis C-methylase UbiE